MKILVLYAHPVETSFNAALHRLIVERLTAAGHEVDDLDLYAEGFDPRLSRAERLAYHDPRGPQDTVDPYVRRLLDAEAPPSLHNIRKVAAVTTYGGSRFRAALMGNPPKKLINRTLRLTVKPGAPVSYLSHYSMNLSTPQSREKFMAKVAAKMDAF